MSAPPFQVLLDAHGGDVYRFLRAAVGPSDADDCWQETFLAALRAYPRLKDARNLKGWILAIAHNKAIDSHRGNARRATPLGVLPDAASHDTESDPELWAAVRSLPPKQRAALLHRYVNDLAYREIARIMSCSDEAARRSVHEGLKKLREVWKQ